MYRIDELITKVNEDEALNLPDNLSEMQKLRIEKAVLEKIDEMRYVSHFSIKKRKMLLLIAVLVLAFGITAFAAKKNEWDIRLINFMGLNDSAVLQLEGGEVTINKISAEVFKDYKNLPEGENIELSITGITSIGDQNSAYIRINTNYELPDEFDETTDYILPEEHSIDITHKNALGQEKIQSYGATFVSFYENGKLGFLCSIENCENLNESHVRFEFENLYWYHDLGISEENDEIEEEELLCEGEIGIEWTYSYRANVKTHHLLKRVESEDGQYFLTKIEISPISIRIEAIRHPKDRTREWRENLLQEIHYKNGEIVKINQTSGGGMKNGIFREEFIKVNEIGEIINTEDIKAMLICGELVEM